MKKFRKIRYRINYLLNQLINISNLKYTLNSFKAFIIDFLKYPLWRFKKRKNGISVLLPTQNEELIVRLSILSFLDFADEIIVVDNGSIDKTKKIIKDLEKKYKKIKFFDRPELPDLSSNRQFALRKSSYRWICRFDSDYVAYTDKENSIKNLRKLLIKVPKGIIPKVISLNKVNVDGDFWHTRKDKFSKYGKVIRGPELRIYEFFPFLTFSRFDKREFANFQNFMKVIKLNQVYYMHCTIKSELNLFLRSERSNWRKSGNYRKYPNLLNFIKDNIKQKYRTEDINEAIRKFKKNIVFNKENYIKYDPNNYLPYPTLIEGEMQKEKAFKIKKYLKNT